MLLKAIRGKIIKQHFKLLSYQVECKKYTAGFGCNKIRMKNSCSPKLRVHGCVGPSRFQKRMTINFNNLISGRQEQISEKWKVMQR